MQGIEVAVKYALLSEKKWDVRDFNYSELASTFSENDKSVVRMLYRVADGEMSGISMLFQLYEVCKKANAKENFEIFYETIFYTLSTIVYEEFRHGLVLKELNCAVDGKESFIKNNPAKNFVQDYFEPIEIWNNPFEVLVSLMVGEIPNIILYREASKKVDSPGLKEILLNISRDEYKHKTAWKDLAKRVAASSPQNREKFIEAYRKAHCVHQAEVGRHYVKGMTDTQVFFTPKIVEEVFQEKVELFRDLFGENTGFDVKEFLSAQIQHVENVVSSARYLKE